ncbi:hypothetical protein G6F17_012223 [Rhizopus arrhizus]|nr:hypothetical protein G6F17_012223 [Rhizopus arrhizus]KAG1125260.1 hypothetical protein G6F42_008877 [Rhizopus arrhizus]
MRSFTVVTLLCTIATVLSAQDCNPTYDTPSAGSCFADCNEKAGKTFFSDWTNDKSSPQFLKSLTLMCQKGTSDYTSFMTKAGILLVPGGKHTRMIPALQKVRLAKLLLSLLVLPLPLLNQSRPL